ncbi:MAG: LacI family DNA-binding transcriptional regulator [Clostridia bacterium]|nr:LacI family DNA-binding transcriptional regulator [Clostridia bacterium]
MPRSEKPHRCTLQDIAERTGFTINTVSRALKDKSDISIATREQIKAVADEMGYIRNRAASSLRSGRTKTIGVIVGGMSNPYYGIMTDAIQNAAADLGYSILIFCSRDNAELESQVVETALSYQVDGILLFPSAGSERTIQRLKAVGIPCVLMARHLDREEDDYVVCDDEQGGYLAARHLIEAGHKRLGFLSSFDVIYSSPRRLKGFFRALDTCGIPRENGLIAGCVGREEALDQLERWRLIGVTGIFVFCDEEAWRAVSLLQAQGKSIPRDMAFVGFDNIQGTLPIPAPLCSVEYSIAGMAQSGIDLLRKRIHEPDLPPQHVIFPPSIVCRGSCGKKDCPNVSAQIPDIYSYLR